MEYRAPGPATSFATANRTRSDAAPRPRAEERVATAWMPAAFR